MNYQDVLKFWFEELTPKQWWVKDPELDATIAKRFGETLNRASQCELFAWRDTPDGRLAEIIVLDQFSRNMYRDQAQAFAADPLAVALAQAAVQTGDDMKIPRERRPFLYMPYMHSESLTIHDEAVRLFTELGIEQNLDYEYKHKAIIDRFGRYPHRNQILGRESTPEEIEFLKGPGSSF
ncbi:MAG: DUF924 domain-containing protein [bacterium]|nr:DUF924 domain-containing protein [bacterium]